MTWFAILVSMSAMLNKLGVVRCHSKSNDFELGFGWKEISKSKNEVEKHGMMNIVPNTDIECREKDQSGCKIGKILINFCPQPLFFESDFPRAMT